MNKEVITDTLQIGNLDGSHFIDLPQVYLEDKLPVDKEDMPTQEDINKWEHLKDIKLPT